MNQRGFRFSPALSGPLAMALAAAIAGAGCDEPTRRARTGSGLDPGALRATPTPAGSADPAVTPTPTASATSVAATGSPSPGATGTVAPATGSASPTPTPSPGASGGGGASPVPTIDPASPSQAVFFTTPGSTFRITLPPDPTSTAPPANLPTTVKLAAYVLLGDSVSTSSAILWKSSDPTIAKVDATGLVTAVGRGAGVAPWYTVISAVAADNLASASRTVEVVADGEIGVSVE
ncbi:MAG: Ig-like domain-containing protein [Candidatus Sericytochromatia bacterium]|nr:Ig-like domain-containing protein [Candidatus Tanganyikabacteria bacterium]